MHRILYRAALIVLLASILAGCSQQDQTPRSDADKKVDLIEVATSERQWTGVAVSREGRIFVNYPNWSPGHGISVAELLSDRSVLPYPDTVWNNWDSTMNPAERFVCVQSVYIDDDNTLWILDPANPMFDGIVDGGPKLIEVNLDDNSVTRVLTFDTTVAPRHSYLNDVRVDTEKKRAFITDSGLGALIVVDLTTGESRRLLSDHPSTKSEDVIVTMQGQHWKRQDGSFPRVHADGIALDTSNTYVYYQSLTGTTLYRVAAEALFDTSLAADQLGGLVERVHQTGPADGILFADDGWLYITSIQFNSVKRYNVSGTVEIVVRDDRLRWPDSFAEGSDGFIYVTTSQIHLQPRIPGPYGIFKFRPE